MAPPGEIVQLSTLAAALRDTRSDDYRDARFSKVDYMFWKPEGRLNRVGAAALDAFAELATCQPDQSVAVAAVLDHGGHIEIYIAGDTEEVPPSVVRHLGNICARILSIRTAVEASSNPTAILEMIRENPHVSEGSLEPALDALRILELDLYRYSIGRVRAHATADPQLRWIDGLSFLIARLKCPPAAALDDLSDGERAALKLLQRSARVQRYLSKLDEAIIRLQGLLAAEPATDLDDVRLREISLALALDLHPLEKDMPYFDQFISAYITRKTGTAPHTPLSTHAWLKKVCCVAIAFRGLTGILVTPALSAMFGARVRIHPIVNTPPKRPYDVAPTADDIKVTIATHGMVKYTASTFIPGRPELFNDLAAELAAAAAKRGHATHIHCECALLCYLWAHGQTMLPYVGLSMAPCIFCAIYFMAYRDIRGIETSTRGTEGQITAAAWMCPDFPDLPEDAAAFQSQLYERLRQYIQKRLLDEHFRRQKISGATYASTAPLTSSNKPDQDRRYALDRFVT
ncbi:uncharacterized protein TRAVEDRAFT_74204 [Trametes versicolor FP-101664 SS1]|uniref:uncharacterized protein n=1 Tax=Trametes versicolor (strain FP-101664) TaxID=717944 RepID=UPI000462425F|nr:uncharacterized protein TRAVEDRAFT_74204 [Trametes versicolor FP-101664 SS1]EIW55388.1 hypothetical protein TRAVEDRAFT_74204 [Trametes versicolor FP-101664 SS1]